MREQVMDQAEEKYRATEQWVGGAYIRRVSKIMG